jgi:putative transposase
MVRTGAVDHPLEWKHSAIHELLGQPERYLIVNMKRLLQCLTIRSEKQFKTWYLKTLEEKLACISHDREGYWSEAIAVGDPGWLNEEAGNMGVKRFKIFTVNNDQCFIGKS